MVGKSLSSDQVGEWILSRSLCNSVPVNNNKAQKAPHKGKSDSRRRLDAEDRNKIREELKKHINPISSEQEHQINIMNGRTAPSELNVNALAIGEHMP